EPAGVLRLCAAHTHQLLASVDARAAGPVCDGEAVDLVPDALQPKQRARRDELHVVGVCEDAESHSHGGIPAAPSLEITSVVGRHAGVGPPNVAQETPDPVQTQTRGGVASASGELAGRARARVVFEGRTRPAFRLSRTEVTHGPSFA